MLISLGVRPIVYSQRKRKLLQLMLFLCGNKRLEKEYILVLPFHN